MLKLLSLTPMMVWGMPAPLPAPVIEATPEIMWDFGSSIAIANGETLTFDYNLTLT